MAFVSARDLLEIMAHWGAMHLIGRWRPAAHADLMSALGGKRTLPAYLAASFLNRLNPRVCYLAGSRVIRTRIINHCGRRPRIPLGAKHACHDDQLALPIQVGMPWDLLPEDALGQARRDEVATRFWPVTGLPTCI